jgi:hypothetical protein
MPPVDLLDREQLVYPHQRMSAQMMQPMQMKLQKKLVLLASHLQKT